MRTRPPALPAAIFRLRLLCALASLLWLIAAVVVWAVVAQHPAAWSASRLPALVSLAPLPAVAGLWAVCFAAERRILKRVWREAHLVCPVCMYPVQDRGVACPECGAEFSARDVRDAWVRADL